MNQPTHNDISKYIDLALDLAATHFGVSFKSPRIYGWRHKSAGCCVSGPLGDGWLRVQGRPCNESPGKLWTGVIESKSIIGVRKPDVLNSFDWQELDWCWRSELLTFISFSVCSPTPELRTPITLPPSWYKSLRTSLENLGQYETDRTNTKQELISRRILEWFGPEIDSKIECWITVHGDIHWANLTSPECWIFDWEAWGRGPKGLDAAFLLCFSLLQPNTAAQVFHYFEDWLTAPDGIRSQLFACAELLRMTKLYGDHPDLSPKLTDLAEHLLNQAPRRNT